jgi:hypothetical protein
MEAQASGLGLKRRIGLLVVSIIVATTMLAAPAQAGVAQKCERNHDNLPAQEKCCKKQTQSNKQRNNCLDYVRSHF